MRSASSTATCPTCAPCSASSARPEPIAGRRSARWTSRRCSPTTGSVAGRQKGWSGSRGSSPPPILHTALRAEALLRCGHLAYWITDFARGDEMASNARALFHELGDPLGEGRALRRLGAIAAATDDLARRAFVARGVVAPSRGRRRRSRDRDHPPPPRIAARRRGRRGGGACRPCGARCTSPPRAITHLPEDRRSPRCSLPSGRAATSRPRSDPGRTRCNSSVSWGTTPWRERSRTASLRSTGARANGRRARTRTTRHRRG